MTWKQFVYQNVIDFCNQKGSRTFSLKEFSDAKIEIFTNFRPNNKYVEEKIRQQLQLLRNDKKLIFLDNTGNYTLRGIDLLKPEEEETKTIDLSKEKPEKREYIMEVYVRNVTWAKQAKEALGDMCIFKNCSNTFLRDDGSRYIEVHHIIPYV